MERALLVKTLVIGALALALLIPVNMIRDLIGERQARRNDAVAGIAAGWGRRQTLTGVYLLVPYERRWAQVTRETVDGSVKERSTERSESRVLRLAADTVDWSIDVATSERQRGIYKARLYTARIRAEGRLAVPPAYGLGDAGSRYRWGAPRLVLGVSDPRGLRSLSPLRVGGAAHDFTPGTGDAALAGGVSAPLPPAIDGRTHAFEFSLELAGAEAFALAPLSRDTRVALRADWPHPSFQGAFLPARHDSRDGGFGAHWQISRFAAQGAEQLAGCGREACAALRGQELGVSFIEPVGLYQQLERAAKYGFLFVGLSFAALLLFELLRRLMIHPIQYALVGLALAIFFLLLSALSEHVSFGLAYGIATLACVGIVTAYVVRVLRSAALGLGFGAALGALYGALYLLLQAEDYALLGGALLLFALLALAMLATRHVDWYRLARRAGTPGEFA